MIRGNNSVVECNLAKVEVAGSNPVSRSKKNERSCHTAWPFLFENERFDDIEIRSHSTFLPSDLMETYQVSELVNHEGKYILTFRVK